MGAETSESGIDMEESSLYTDENIDEVLGEDDVDDEDDENHVPDSARDLEISRRQGRDENHVPDSARDLEISRRQGRDEELSRRQLDLARGRDDSGFSEFEKNAEQRDEEIIARFDSTVNELMNDLNPAQHVDEVNDEVNTVEVRRQQQAVTRFDQLIGISKEVREKEPEVGIARVEKKAVEELVTPVQLVDLEKSEGIDVAPLVDLSPATPSNQVAPLVDLSLATPSNQVAPVALYENIIIANQMLELSSSNPGEVVGFPLSPLHSVEPPKEKPPPPPLDMSDEEAEAPELPPKTSLRRLDSTKRIKKEIRKKRSDFLGIEGANDDGYLEPEVGVEPPPDMMTLLREERRHDQQLYRQSLSSEADSTENVEVLANAVNRLDKSLFLDQGLYRQSICSESDSNHETAESRDSGVELDRGHVDDLCWNKQSPEPHSRQNSEPYGNPSITSEEDEIMKKEREIIEVLEKEEKWRYGKALSAPEDSTIGETLAVKLRQLEQEKMQLEWERAEEEGRRMADEERLQAKETLLRQQETSPNINQTSHLSQDNLRSERERLEKEQIELARVRQELLVRQQPADPPRQGPMGTNLRYSMPDLQDARPPPPAARPSSTWTRVPSADNLLAPQQMSRTTRQALSAAPRSRIVNGETWMQPKRKPDASKGTYNNQHWLIQEAEHRRITEQQQRAVQARRSLPNQQRSPAHQSPSQQQQQQRPHSGHFAPSHVSPVPLPPSHTVVVENGVHYASQSVPSHARTASSPHHAQLPMQGHIHSHSPMSPPSHHTVGLPPTPPAPHPHPHHTNKPLPQVVIQTITQRIQNKPSPRRRIEESPSPTKLPSPGATHTNGEHSPGATHTNGEQERMLSVSGKKKCSHCGEELGRGAAMVIESLRLFYHIDCFKCCVCHSQLGDGLMGTDVRVRNNKLHCHNCYSSDDGVKFSCV